ncbi:phage holin [Enterococcus faecium]
MNNRTFDILKWIAIVVIPLCLGEPHRSIWLLIANGS